MADFVDATVREIESRIEELQEELTKLEAARTALVGIRRGPGRPKATSSQSSGGSTSASGESHGGRRRGPGRPRGRRGAKTRSAQALDLVRQRPGITIPQIAEELKIEPNYLYRVMPGLVSDGLVRRDGNGWFSDAEQDSTPEAVAAD